MLSDVLSLFLVDPMSFEADGSEARIDQKSESSISILYLCVTPVKCSTGIFSAA
jgi:hypothetical protein